MMHEVLTEQEYRRIQIERMRTEAEEADATHRHQLHAQQGLSQAICVAGQMAAADIVLDALARLSESK